MCDSDNSPHLSAAFSKLCFCSHARSWYKCVVLQRKQLRSVQLLASCHQFRSTSGMNQFIHTTSTAFKSPICLIYNEPWQPLYIRVAYIFSVPKTQNTEENKKRKAAAHTQEEKTTKPSSLHLLSIYYIFWYL